MPDAAAAGALPAALGLTVASGTTTASLESVPWPPQPKMETITVTPRLRPRVAGFRIQLFIIAFLLVFLLSISLSGNTKRPETEPAFPSPRQSAEGIRLTESKSSARTVAKVAGSIRGASTDRGASWLLTGRRLPRAWRLRQSPVGRRRWFGRGQLLFDGVDVIQQGVADRRTMSIG